MWAFDHWRIRAALDQLGLHTLFSLVKRMMWEQPGLSCLENCDSPHLSLQFVEGLGTP